MTENCLLLTGLGPPQPNPTPFRFNFENFDIQDVADFQDSAKGNLAFVQQAVLFDTNIDKGAEIDNVADGAFQLEADRQVFHFQHVGAQDGSRGFLARVAPRADELFEDVLKRREAAAKFSGQFFGLEFFEGGFALA